MELRNVDDASSGPMTLVTNYTGGLDVGPDLLTDTHTGTPGPLSPTPTGRVGTETRN